jgi:hypothetical protein
MKNVKDNITLIFLEFIPIILNVVAFYFLINAIKSRSAYDVLITIEQIEILGYIIFAVVILLKCAKVFTTEYLEK